MDIDTISIRKKLETILPEWRMEHSLGVQYTATALAMCHDVNIQAASLAGLLHDCAKAIKKQDKILECQMNGIIISDYEYNNPDMLHGKLGAFYAKNQYHIDDPDILNAIQYHTTGRPNMSPLEKIIYVADYIEPNRNAAPNLDKLRKIAFTNLNDCLLAIFKQTVTYLEHSGAVIDQTSIAAYNYYKKQLGDTIE